MVYKNVIFIHIPRTGGTSIESSLGLQLKEDNKHLTALELRRQVGEEKWKKSFVFTFVRNPWDRIISLYHQPYFRNQKSYLNNNLEYFINNYEPASWEKQFFFEYLDTSGIDYFGKFENRTNDLEEISKLSGIKFNIAIHKRRTNRNSDYRTYYNDKTAQLVYDRYFLDIEQYGYSF